MFNNHVLRTKISLSYLTLESSVLESGSFLVRASFQNGCRSRPAQVNLYETNVKILFQHDLLYRITDMSQLHISDLTIYKYLRINVLLRLFPTLLFHFSMQITSLSNKEFRSHSEAWNGIE